MSSVTFSGRLSRSPTSAAREKEALRRLPGNPTSLTWGMALCMREDSVDARCVWSRRSNSKRGGHIGARQGSNRRNGGHLVGDPPVAWGASDEPFEDRGEVRLRLEADGQGDLHDRHGVASQ